MADPVGAHNAMAASIGGSAMLLDSDLKRKALQEKWSRDLLTSYFFGQVYFSGKGLGRTDEDELVDTARNVLSTFLELDESVVDASIKLCLSAIGQEQSTVLACMRLGANQVTQWFDSPSPTGSSSSVEPIRNVLSCENEVAAMAKFWGYCASELTQDGEPDVNRLDALRQCIFNGHRWDNTCQCKVCGQTDTSCSDFFHDWNGQTCRRCGKTRSAKKPEAPTEPTPLPEEPEPPSKPAPASVEPRKKSWLRSILGMR